jgi:hypothetical protein
MFSGETSLSAGNQPCLGRNQRYFWKDKLDFSESNQRRRVAKLICGVSSSAREKSSLISPETSFFRRKSRMFCGRSTLISGVTALFGKSSAYLGKSWKRFAQSASLHGGERRNAGQDKPNKA